MSGEPRKESQTRSGSVHGRRASGVKTEVSWSRELAQVAGNSSPPIASSAHAVLRSKPRRSPRGPKRHCNGWPRRWRQRVDLVRHPDRRKIRARFCSDSALSSFRHQHPRLIAWPRKHLECQAGSSDRSARTHPSRSEGGGSRRGSEAQREGSGERSSPFWASRSPVRRQARIPPAGRSDDMERETGVEDAAFARNPEQFRRFVSVGRLFVRKPLMPVGGGATSARTPCAQGFPAESAVP